jgi:hypothetical protein
MTVENDLIFDLGLHTGMDAQFYLAKGFRVVGVEASADLCRRSADFLGYFGDRLTIVNKALAPRPNEQVTFYVVPDKDDWGSLDRGIAEKGVMSATEIVVDTIDLPSLIGTHGHPYYIKCDLEGGDAIFLEQLQRVSPLPVFVSVEMNDGSEADRLAEMGFEAGQIVNQYFNPTVKPPEPAREGSFVARRFTHETSGLFGHELPRDRWRPLSEVRALYDAWRDLRGRDETLAPGWLDLHACRWETLEADRNALGPTAPGPTAPGTTQAPPKRRRAPWKWFG